MTLLAQAQDLTTAGLAFAAFTAVAAFGTTWLSVLAARDKLRFDADRLSDRATIATLQEDVAECRSDREAQRVQIATLQGQNQAQGSAIAELQAELIDLRQRTAPGTRRRPRAARADDADAPGGPEVG